MPIVLLSGVADLAAAAAALGWTSYVVAKPCQLAALLDTVKRALTERTQV